METKTIPRMRTVAKIVSELRAIDPQSDVTEYCIRQMVKTGAVKVFWVGNKALINLNDVLDILRMGNEPQEPSPQLGIRRVNEHQRIATGWR